MLRLAPREAQVGSFAVQRMLPKAACRKVGPWVFLDRFGPAEVTHERATDVRPHPHCALSTVTFLFAGQVEHRDSTGGHARIRPGEVHWMRGGHGVVHSERSPEDVLGQVETSFGLQLWCAHPDGEEEQEPRFDSYRDLPELEVEGVRVQLLAGHGWGAVSPVDVTSPLVYAIAHLVAGQSLAMPDHAERCVYPVTGRISVEGEVSDRDLLVLEATGQTVTALDDTLLVVLGGDPVGPRHMWWNLIHSDKGRLIEQAERWRNRDFPSIPGDGVEFIPAPEGPW